MNKEFKKVLYKSLKLAYDNCPTVKVNKTCCGDCLLCWTSSLKEELEKGSLHDN